jgi:hypothetical protein
MPLKTRKNDSCGRGFFTTDFTGAGQAFQGNIQAEKPACQL